jgi:arylsulfatase A
MYRPLFAPWLPAILTSVVVTLDFLMASPSAAADAPKKPNIVLVLADDLGYTDLACYGSKLYETPYIDQLARDGMKFTQNYSACTVCSPTRAALLTGKYPARLHITDWIPGLEPENPKMHVPDWTKHLPNEEMTIARALKDDGYATASIGKWHLGGKEYYPEKHGFDINIAGSDKPDPRSYFAPYKMSTIKQGPDGEYITDRLTDEAIKFIDANRDRPFFLYLPHFAVHLPLQAKQAMIKKYEAKIKYGMKQNNAIYAAMVESLDESVGRIRAELKRLKIDDHTIVILASDNGGRIPTTSNLPLRDGKASCHEGGTRVPLIIDWPGVTKPGSVCDTPVITMDLFPTLLTAVGATAHVKDGLDGVDIAPLLRQSGKIDRDELFWHYPHYQHYQLGGTIPYSAIHKGDLKYIEYHDDTPAELYDLHNDLGEQHNLADARPNKVKELRDRLHAWRKEVGAQMPTPNPDYDPSRPMSSKKPPKGSSEEATEKKKP